MAAGENAQDDINIHLVDQALGFLEGDIRPALRVRDDGINLVLARDPALLINEINGDLDANGRGN